MGVRESKRGEKERETTRLKKKEKKRGLSACEPALLSTNDRCSSLVIDVITTESHARLSAHWKYCGPGVDLISLILSCVSHMSVQVQASGLKKAKKKQKTAAHDG